MKHLSEYRNKDMALAIAQKIAASAGDRTMTFMEVCGTHTMAIARFGIKKLLPPTIRLISGPGCPVCVTPIGYIDHAIALAKRPDTVICTFGDMMRVPGSTSSLEKEKAKGADVRMVYSTIEALKTAKNNSDKEVVFLGVGFETTAPTIAASILKAKNEGIKNYSVLSANKTVPKALETLISLVDTSSPLPLWERVRERGLNGHPPSRSLPSREGGLHKISYSKREYLNGFILPGHVSTMIGANSYNFIPEKYNIACAIAGFEPVDILLAIFELVKQNTETRPKVSTEYTRAVDGEGNKKAMAMLFEVFELCDASWRGVGGIPGSGLKMKDEFAEYDASKKFSVQIEKTVEPNGCICGEILCGKKTPAGCPLFGKVCTPENPVGACMVSSEGTCAAYFKYSS